MYQGKAFSLDALGEGLVELVFNLEGESVNKFNLTAMTELEEVLSLLEKSDTDKVKGLLIRSAKSAFVVGADIREFGAVFKQGPEAIKFHLSNNNTCFNRLEELPFPTVVAVTGYALGGGMEFCLACDYRLASTTAKLGLPEAKLGIIPGWGGTVRLPRVAGVDVAVEWIASGKEQSADKALTDGVFDGVVDDEGVLVSSALSVLTQLVDGKLDYKQRRELKRSPLKINDMEALLSFESSKAFIKGQAGRNYPAPVAAVQAIQEAAKCFRDEALAIESNHFIALAQGSVAQCLIGIFLGDQLLTKKAKSLAALDLGYLKNAAVLGAGIMGGGITYQAAHRGIPVLMKDIAQSGLDLGLEEASKLLNNRIKRGRITAADQAATLNRITATLSYDGFADRDIVVEAVVENIKVKQSVLVEAERHMSKSAVLCSNTSTISISSLSEALRRPENFCGMHFFNPVHAMPLVEVIRGAKTSEATIAKAVDFAVRLGKKPVVVNDCPGFLVNRVLFPYFAGFAMLLRDGADFKQVDRVMERWGWPMGPAYLIDVVGIDTAVHAQGVMGEGFPDRLGEQFTSPFKVLLGLDRLGQKNGRGFYQYQNDKRGKPQKLEDESVYEFLKPHVSPSKQFDDEEIIARMMVPMATELLRCIDEGVVDTPQEADLALVYGIGFPPFRGGICKWIDTVGLSALEAMSKQFVALGPLYELTPEMHALMAKNTSFYNF